MQARSFIEAQVIVALLRGAGIPAHADAPNRYDELAVAQRLLNQEGVQVSVPSDRLEEARRVVLDARENNAIGEDEYLEDAPDAQPAPPAATPSPRPWGLRLLAFGLGIAAVVFLCEWIAARRDLMAMSQHPLYVIERPDPSRLVYVSKQTKRPVWELVYGDQDGVMEKLVYHYHDGSRAEWTDVDSPGIPRRREGFDADGKLVRVDEDRSDPEFVRVR